MAAPEADGPLDSRDESLPHVALLTLVGGVVVLAVTAATLALWEGRAVLLLLFLAYTLGAAMRPGVESESLVRLGIPRAFELVGHFALFFGLVALLLWLIVPIAFEQAQQALADVPRHDAATDHGLLYSVRKQTLSSLESRLSEISEPSTALSTLVGTLAALAGVAFTLAAAAYWVVERDRLVNVVLAVVPHEKRTTVRDTWLLIDLKLGAVIRTKLLLVDPDDRRHDGDEQSEESLDVGHGSLCSFPLIAVSCELARAVPKASRAGFSRGRKDVPIPA